MLKNIIKTNKDLIVTLDDGTVLMCKDTSRETFNAIVSANSNDEIIAIVCPENETAGLPKVVSNNVKKAYNGDFDSNVIEFRGNSAYIPSISELTVPQDFVEAIIDAEMNHEEQVLEAYLNFWTLVSLNPDSRVRDNLFWFIKKWNIKICRNGLIVTYRNADFKTEGKYGLDVTKRVTDDWVRIKGQKRTPKKYYYDAVDDTTGMPTNDSKLHKVTEGMLPAETLDDLYNKLSDVVVDKTTFTDQHSHSFTIKLGEPVSMPREKCDCEQEHSCSAGLHQGGPGWLKKGYYGDTGLVCLVNPANVVAIPHEDSYGKMRVCEYLPIAIASYDEDGNVIENIDSNGFDLGDKYLVDYSGKVNNEDLDNYVLTFARTVGIDRDAIASRIFDMAQKNLFTV